MTIKLKPEPAGVKYITEDNLPTDDLKFLCDIIGLEATKKLMINILGFILSIQAYCNQPYKIFYTVSYS